MKKQNWVTFGVVMGMIAARMSLPLVSVLLTKMTSNQVSQEQVTAYINNSKEVELLFSNYSYKKWEYNSYFSPNHMLRSGYLFYDFNYQKYFSIEIFDMPRLFDKVLDDTKNISFKTWVNTQLLNDTAYGSINNPLPIFFCTFSDSILSLQDKYDFDLKHNNEESKRNVGYYLTYFMPSKEFKKMFEK